MGLKLSRDAQDGGPSIPGLSETWGQIQVVVHDVALKDCFRARMELSGFGAAGFILNCARMELSGFSPF